MTIEIVFTSLLYAVAGLGVVLALVETKVSKASGIWPKVFLQMLMFYGAWLMPFLLVFAIYQYRAGQLPLATSIGFGAFAVVYFYGRVVEPKLLQVHTHRVDMQLKSPITIALVADIHVGLFSGYKRQLKCISEKLNALDGVDVIVFSGDWTYEPGSNLQNKLKPLADIKKPCYHVLGNHDEQEPGPDITAELLDALETHEIINAEGKLIDLGSINLIGVGDLWASKAEFHHFSPSEINNKPTAILAHNPDTVDYIPSDLFTLKPLMLSGHTHGGQIYTPWLRDYLFKKHSATGYVQGLYQHKKAQVFVTVGTGMVFVPFRIGVPPRIDVLTLH